MFHKNVKKSEKVDNSLTIFHRKDKIPRSDILRSFSLDPGVKNFCIRIEARNKKQDTCECAYLEKINLSNEENIYVNITNILDKLYEEFLLECNYFLIEKQMVENYKSTRIMQHVISYLLIRIPKDIPAMIVEVSPKLKSSALNAPKGMTKYYTKKWHKEWAIQRCKEDGDDFTLDIIVKSKKQDDYCDTKAMVEAFYIYNAIMSF